MRSNMKSGVEDRPLDVFGFKTTTADFKIKKTTRLDIAEVSALAKSNRSFRDRSFTLANDKEDAGDLVQMYRHRSILAVGPPSPGYDSIER